MNYLNLSVLVLCVLSATHSLADSVGNIDSPIAIIDPNAESRIKRLSREEDEEYYSKLETKTSGLGALELLVLEMHVSPPDPSVVAQYRGANTQNLEAMLRDADFIKHWWIIAKTIGMIADKDSAHRLLAYIKSDISPPEYADQRNAARFAGIHGLKYYMRDNQDPEIMHFIIGLLNETNVQKLNLGEKNKHNQVRRLAEGMLAFIATDPAIAILEKKQAELRNLQNSEHMQNASQSEKSQIDNHEAWLDRLINEARRKQAGLPKEPPKDGDPIP